MAKRIPIETINKVKSLRQQGWSLLEIKNATNLGYGTVFRYMRNVEMLPEFRSAWRGKRGGSIKRKLKKEAAAKIEAKKTINSLTSKEKMIFLSAIYWGEGSKAEFGLSNTDPELIRIFVMGLQEVFNISPNRLRVSVRIFEDLNKEKCLKYWSAITGVPVYKFISVNVLQGKKRGKLQYGMCRVRVEKSGDLLKYITALKNEVVFNFAPIVQRIEQASPKG